MRCRSCPHSLACMSGRLDGAFMLVALCPMCERLYLLKDPKVEEDQEKQREQQRIDEAAKHGIDLTYEQELHEHQFVNEYLCVPVPIPRNDVIMFHCELRPVSRAARRRWSKMHSSHGRYAYTAGWSMKDPPGLLPSLGVRPCPDCVRWPESHIIEDLDEQKKYEAEKAGATPAFGLKGRR